MRPNIFLSLTGAALLAVWSSAAAAQDALPADLAPHAVEGDLWAADCLGQAPVARDCNRRALQSGKPGGLLAARGAFTLLLLDGRVLAHGCTGQPPTRLRARGLLVLERRALYVFRLQALCGERWQVMNLPYGGSEGASIEVGNK